MKKYTQNSLFFVHPLTIIYISIGMIVNEYQVLFFGYLFSFIHELGHVLCAKMFKVKVEKVTLLPIGFTSKMEGVENLSSLKQIFIYISGPLTFFISLLIINLLKRIDIISIYGYEEAFKTNLLILLYNMLPFYPLDGGKIIDCIFSNYIDEYILRKIRIFINFLVVFILFLYFKTNGQYLILIFMMASFILQIKNFQKDYFRFLFLRLVDFKERKKLFSKKEKIVRMKDNYFFENGKIFSEREIVSSRIKKINQKKLLNKI